MTTPPATRAEAEARLAEALARAPRPVSAESRLADAAVALRLLRAQLGVMLTEAQALACSPAFERVRVALAGQHRPKGTVIDIGTRVKRSNQNG